MTLRVLNLEHNTISVLPIEMCLLRELEVLNLAYNRFTRIPSVLLTLFQNHHRLQSLSLNDNPITHLIEKKLIHYGSLLDLLGYLNDILKFGVIPFYETKIHVLGQEVCYSSFSSSSSSYYYYYF